ncbi:MAG: hypothetical protein ACQETX_13205 [Pseudomonadota bacterium]
MRKILSAVAIVPLLSACSFLGKEENQASPEDCPGVVALEETREQVSFVGESRDLTQVDYSAELVDVRYGCEYRDGGREIAMEMDVILAASRGPANRDRQAELSYYLAIGHPGNPPEILVREAYSAPVSFEGNENSVTLTDEASMTLPLADGETSSDYRVFVGLVLSRDEVDYNRNSR